MARLYSDSRSVIDLVVVTVSHNHGRFLSKYLTSVLSETAGLAAEVHVVDNCSTDDTLHVLSHFPSVHTHRNAVRKGFAANNNLVIRSTTSRYVLLLNPDTEVGRGALPRLIGFLDSHGGVAMVGPKLVFPDGHIQLSARRFPTLRSVIVRRTPLRLFLRGSEWNREHLMADEDHEEAREVDWLLGSCLLIRRVALEQVGYLDEGYFLYVEDIDLALTLRKAGWKTVYLPDAVVVHHHLAVSDKRLFSVASLYHMRGMFRYWLKHMAPDFVRSRLPGRGQH